MRVLMLAPQPFLEPRGTPISVYQRLQALAALGYDVDLVTYHLGKNVDLPGVSIHRIPQVPFIKQIKVGPSLAKLLLDVILLCKAIGMLVRKRYDVIHSHEEAAFFAVVLAALFRTRHLYDMHSSLPRQLSNFGYGNYRPMVKLFAWLEDWVIHTCDAVITIGADLEDYVKALNPQANHARLENLPIQVNKTPASRSSVAAIKQRLGLNGQLPIVYTGTFERYQGLDLLIESADIVRRHTDEVAFVLVGGKPAQVEYWQDEVRKHGLEGYVFFTGLVPLDEVGAYMELAEILVSPRTEGTSVPLKIYSYLLSGKPVIATKLEAHTQILTDDLALLVKPTKEDLAAGMLKLIEAPTLRQRIGRQAQDFARATYDPSAYIATLASVYQSLHVAPAPSVADSLAAR